MKTVEVLGREGCSRCSELENKLHELAQNSEEEIQVAKIDDLQTVAERGVMSTPGLVVDGELVTTGRVPSMEELKNLIT